MINRSIFSLFLLSGCVVALLTSCAALPASGPAYRNTISLKETAASHSVPAVEWVDVSESIIGSLNNSAEKQSFRSLLQHLDRPAGAVGEGDILDIAIWEAPPALLFGGVLTSQGSGNAHVMKLPEQMVGSDGKISVPFLGLVYVKGKTPAVIQSEISGRLKKMANQPQVMVRLVKNNSTNVLVVKAGNTIRMPLTAHGERVLDAVAAAGGVADNVRDVSVQLTRKGVVKTLAFETLIEKPSENVLLETGDVVTLHSNPLSFTALGAVGKVQQFRFAAKGLSLAEALGLVGGTSDRRAAAQGVFVFRYQPLSLLKPSEQDKWIAKGYKSESDIPVVYRIDLSDARSLFWIQKFPMQDKDILYVANSPLAEMQKFLQFVFSPVVSGVGSINNLGN
ncbi:polysaccharide biosynthesis/export family protein [Neisseria dumasiana]|uniref:Sugar ABC transporter substrate-binding protein n=1 Tax=Neisseria dumasiana TaxID=1931275 RepID=A0A1X3DH43_9NEIS|nr:polysaccharide biosynthesis/export family protein [Neisseria dumasiana]OSI19797.1 sugar ABC transporter substrate-binding protein [Neisseria dumasiana]UOO84742.1 polysaccharide export protein [Neisseria dumasiana]